MYRRLLTPAMKLFASTASGGYSSNTPDLKKTRVSCQTNRIGTVRIDRNAKLDQLSRFNVPAQTSVLVFNGIAAPQVSSRSRCSSYTSLRPQITNH